MAEVVVLCGPGGKAFNSKSVQKLVSALLTAGAEVSVIGDGDASISKERIGKALDAISRRSEEPITLFIMAHGDLENGTHVINFDGEYGMTAGELFDMAARSFHDQSIDMFMTCCHGGAAIPEVDKLPLGSTFAVLAPGRETVSGFDIHNFIPAIDAGDFSVSHLINCYLGKALKTRTAPSIAVSGQGVRDLPGEFIARIGQLFSGTEKEAVHKALDRRFGTDRVDWLMDRISSAPDEWGVLVYDYGAALAVTLAASSQMQPLSSYDPNLPSFSRDSEYSRDQRDEEVERRYPSSRLLQEVRVPPLTAVASIKNVKPKF